MNMLFRERIGQMLLMVAIGMQTAGFVWIRQVVKIEV
jgi:Flp pilus assembly protein TadB